MARRSSVTGESGGDISAQARQVELEEPSGRADDAGGYIVVIEKRALIQDCLRRCLGQVSDLEVIAVADVEDWLERAATVEAALVILSVPGTSGSSEAQREINRLLQGPHARPTIVISDGEDLEQIVGILDSGVLGYIPTSLPLDVAAEAIRLVRAGGIFVPASSLVGARRPGEAASAARGSGIFTARQAAVVDALRRGKANKVIAYELKMRESTVKVHVRNIMKKLNARNRTEVAYMANELIRGGDNHAR